MNKRTSIISLVLCLSLISSVQAEQKQYLQIMHENQYKKQQPQAQQTVKTNTVKQSTPKTQTSTQKSYTPPVDNKKCDEYIQNALTQIDQNNLYAAQTSLTRALDINPNHVRALKIRGQVRNRLGNNTGAMQDLDKAISIKADGDLHYARGVVRLSMQNYSDAIKDFDKAIEFNPGDDMAYHQRGYCYCLLARVTTTPSYFNKALPDFNQSLQLNPSNIESYLYRGMAKAELNGANAGMADIEYAMKEYQRTGDTNGYQRSVEIYDWIKQDY